MTTDFTFRADRKLSEVLSGGGFTLSAEVIPPRNGAEQVRILKDIEALIRAGAQFLAVTKGAGGSLRGGSLPIAQLIKERFGVPCIAHFTCRDLLPADIENQLMDHHLFGVRNILALRGDPPDGQPGWQTPAGGYSYAHELIRQIVSMNHGEYLRRANAPTAEAAGTASREKTDFCIGAAAYAEWPDETERIEFFRRKVEAGAHYGITDMLFDAEAYARFIELCRKHGLAVPVLPGTRLLRSREQVDRMTARFKVQVPRAMYDALPARDVDGEGSRRGVDLFMGFVERLRALGAPGIHVFVIGDVAGACDILTGLAWKKRKDKYSRTES